MPLPDAIFWICASESPSNSSYSALKICAVACVTNNFLIRFVSYNEVSYGAIRPPNSCFTALWLSGRSMIENRDR